MSGDSKSIVEKFGVELEMLFAFHEDRLIPVLKRRGLTKQHIVKQLSSRTRSNIGIKTIPGFANPQSRPSHRGWALRIDENDRDDWKHQRSDIVEDYRAGRTTKYRTYWAEALEIVRNIVDEHALNVEVELSTHPDDPTYKDWKVSNDCSLVPLSKEQKMHYFGDRIAAGQSDDWDTTGIEVVSVPLQPDNAISFHEIDQYLTALRGNNNSNYGITTSKYAGLHVHIGFGKPEPKDPASLLLRMQHLAYMLVQFEPLLVRFFPPYRDGGRPGNIICENDTRSNLAGILRWETETYGRANPTLQDIATTIFKTTSIAALRVRMHHDKKHKGYQVNFRNIEFASIQPWNKKRTVEFRLHESTIDAHEIEMWVRFCLAFCRTAERQAANSTDWNGEKITESTSSTTEYSKYEKRNLDDVVTTTDLFDLLQLDDELRKYWQARWDKYHDDQHMELPTPELRGPFSPSSSEDSNGNDPDEDDDPDNGDSKGKGKKTGRSKKSLPTPKAKGKGNIQTKEPFQGNTKASKSTEKSATSRQSPKSQKKSPGIQTKTQGQKRKSESPTPSLRRSKRLLESAK